MTKDQHWIDLERVAALILTEVNPLRRVTHNARLRGRLTLVDRQIDVLIEDPDTNDRIVVDCKDWARPVDAPHAGAFATLLEDVDATGGLMICNRGFTAAASNLARAKGFRLASLHDIERTRWQVDALLPVVWRRYWISEAQALLRVADLGTDHDFVATGQVSCAGAPNGDVRTIVEEAWLRGEMRGTPYSVLLVPRLLHTACPGRGAPAQLVVALKVSSFCRLAWLKPIKARGLLDRETRAFHTAHLDLQATLRQDAIDWIDVEDVTCVPGWNEGSALTITEIVPAKIGVEGLPPTRTNPALWAQPPDMNMCQAVDFRHLSDPHDPDYRSGMQNLRPVTGDPMEEERWIERPIRQTLTNNPLFLVETGATVEVHRPSHSPDEFEGL